MNLTEATQIVIDDTRESYANMTDADAIVTAFNTVNPDTLDLSSPDTAMAYHVVLNFLGELTDDPKGPRLQVDQAVRELLAH